MQQNYKALVFTISLLVRKRNKARNMLECLDLSLGFSITKNGKETVVPVKETIHNKLRVVSHVMDYLYDQSCSKCLVKGLDLK